jgi:hypothetical protein
MIQYRKGECVRPGSLPISQLILLDLFIPPIGAVLWRFMAGGWAAGVQGGKASEETRKRQWLEFWVLLGLAYAVMFGFTVYAWLA